jgi:hypothetical protein
MTQTSAPASQQPDLSQALAEMEKARARGRGRRSPLYLWFRANHDRIAEEFSQNAPSWPALAAFLGKNGLTNGDGKPPSAEGARTVWYRVRREMAAVRARKSSPKAETETAPGVRLLPSASSSVPPPGLMDHDEDAENQRRPVFTMATLRGMKPSGDSPMEVAKPAATTSPTPVQDIDPQEVLSRFLGINSPNIPDAKE